MDAVTELRAVLNRVEDGLGRHAEALHAAGVSADRFASVSVDVLADVLADSGIPDEDWGRVMRAARAAVRARAGLAPSLAPPVLPALAALESRISWHEAILERWPGPIAHEYHRLREEMQAGRTVGVVWQLRDLAEVIIKFPVLALARDIVVNAPPEVQNEVRLALFGRPLSFGHWFQILRETLCPIVGDHRARLAFPELISPFYGAPEKQGGRTALLNALEDILRYRNEAIGHGANRLNESEFVDDIDKHFEPLNEALGLLVAAGTWSGLALRLGGPAGDNLIGWRSIRARHETAPGEGEHEEATGRLFLVAADGRSLALWPFIGARLCETCGKRDVFFYDSRGGERAADEFILLDYLAGHRMKKRPRLEPDLARETEGVRVPDVIEEEHRLIDDRYGQADLDRLLLAKASEARYIRPDYLHEPLAQFLETRDRGVFWLVAPGHIGKSVFVRGLTDRAYWKKGRPPLEALNDAATCRFAVKREVQYSIGELETAIREQVLQEGFGLREKEQRFPSLDREAADAPAAFASYLSAVMALKPRCVSRVVIFIDGLDELRLATNAGIERFLPAPAALPQDCFLVLTSRPLAHCPPFVRQALEQLGYGADNLSVRMDLAIDGPDPLAARYRALLRAYFQRETKDRVDPGGADAAFEIILEKSGGRFGYVAFLTDLLVRGLAGPAELAELPREGGLYARYLEDLERALGGTKGGSAKPWDYVKKVLVALAADEIAFDAESQWLKETFPGREYQGMNLEDLAQALDEADVTYRLVSVVYAFQTMFASWRAASERTSRYGLGLRDLKETIQTRYPADLINEHTRAAEPVLAPIREMSASLSEVETLVPAELARETEGLIRALGHEAAVGKDLAGDPSALQPILERLSALGKRCMRLLELRPALASITVETAIRRIVLEKHPTQKTGLAEGLISLGAIKAECVDFRGAMKAYQSSLDLQISHWYPRNPKAWPQKHQDSLIATFNQMGTLAAESNDFDAALEGFNAAIELSEWQREQRTTWTMSRQEALAGLYINRANSKANWGDLAGAIDDFNSALTVVDELLSNFSGRPPVDLLDMNALILGNRGLANAHLRDFKSALADFDNAILLIREILVRSEAARAAVVLNSLSAAYSNRALAKTMAADHVGALADLDEAIEIQEAIRRSYKDQWPVLMQRNLIDSLLQRAELSEKHAVDGVQAACRDWNMALSLVNDLKQRLDPSDSWEILRIDLERRIQEVCC